LLLDFLEPSFFSAFFLSFFSFFWAFSAAFFAFFLFLEERIFTPRADSALSRAPSALSVTVLIIEPPFLLFLSFFACFFSSFLSFFACFFSFFLSFLLFLAF